MRRASIMPVLRPDLGLYLLVSYVVAAIALYPFAGNLQEVFAFGIWVWAVPAVVSLISSKGATPRDRYVWPVACLSVIILLCWIVGLTFQMTY